MTILNLSVGDTDEFQVRVRNPKGCTATLASPRDEREARAVYDAPGDELTVTIPNLGGWQIATLFL